MVSKDTAGFDAAMEEIQFNMRHHQQVWVNINQIV